MYALSLLTSLSDLIPSSLSAYVHITFVPPFIRRSVLACILSPLTFPSYFLSLSLYSCLNTRRFYPSLQRARARARRSFHAILLLPSLFIPSPCFPSPPWSFLIVHARLPAPPFSHSPLTPSDFLRHPPRPRRVPFAPSLIYCITVHEVANLRRVILYKYVSQINFRATTICMSAVASRRRRRHHCCLSLSLLSSVRLSCRGI